jgi:hypothetical protein
MAAGRIRAVLAGVHACGVLLAGACSNGNRVAERVSCYPACLANIVLHCPMISACDTATGTNAQITDPDLMSGTSSCFASGETLWQAKNAATNADTVVVKRADGSECYTAISDGASTRYAITVGGNAVAELAVDPQSATATITCNGTATAVAANADCFVLPWMTAACMANACSFGALPAGSAAATTN